MEVFIIMLMDNTILTHFGRPKKKHQDQQKFVIAREDVSEFFRSSLDKMGFNKQEKQDF
jgi:hypothetical protein